jgi:hypothetical protein
MLGQKPNPGRERNWHYELFLRSPFSATALNVTPMEGANMDADRSCFEASEMGFSTYYEIPREIYQKLQSLSGRMEESPGVQRFAEELRSLLDQIACVFEE